MSLDGLRLSLIDINEKIQTVLDDLCDPIVESEINLRATVRDLFEVKQNLELEIGLIFKLTEEEENEILAELLSNEDEEDGLDD